MRDAAVFLLVAAEQGEMGCEMLPRSCSCQGQLISSAGRKKREEMGCEMLPPSCSWQGPAFATKGARSKEGWDARGCRAPARGSGS